MPQLTVPPQVRIGTSSWTLTSWAPDYPVEDVKAGPNRCPRDGRVYVHWAVYVGSDSYAQVCRLLVQGPDCPAGGPAALAVPAGTLPTRIRATSGDELLADDTEPLVVA